jgi:hypothetical protein
MSEKNISEKLTESITKLIKKTNTFEKIETLLNGVSLFMFITGAVTLYNSYKLHKITEYANPSKNKIDDKINAKLDKIIETNEKIIHLQMGLLNSLQNNEVLKPKISLTEQFETQTNDNKIYDDDEILNECYDNIPCNNSKKSSGLNRIFGWK